MRGQGARTPRNVVLQSACPFLTTIAIVGIIAQAINMNFRFTGAPGTGKTTVARRVGRMFKQLKVIHSDDVVSCSPSDLTTG